MEKKKLNISVGFTYGTEYKWDFVDQILAEEGFDQEERDKVESLNATKLNYEKEGKILTWRKNETNNQWRCNYQMIS